MFLTSVQMTLAFLTVWFWIGQGHIPVQKTLVLEMCEHRCYLTGGCSSFVYIRSDMAAIMTATSRRNKWTFNISKIAYLKQSLPNRREEIQLKAVRRTCQKNVEIIRNGSGKSICFRKKRNNRVSPIISIYRRAPVQGTGLVVTCAFDKVITEPARFYRTPKGIMGECSSSHSCDSRGILGYSLSLDTDGKVMRLNIPSVNAIRDSGTWYCREGGHPESNNISLSHFATQLDWKAMKFAPPLSSLPTKLSFEESVNMSVTTPCVKPSTDITWRYQEGVTGLPFSCTYSSEETCPQGLSRTHSTLTIHRTDPYTPQVILTISVEHDSFDPPTYTRSQTLHAIQFPTCPDEWILYEHSCYSLKADSKTWQQAEDACQLQNGHLVAIETDDENTLLKEVVTSSQDRPGHVWIGASDTLSEGDYRWISTNGELTFTGWAPGEPSGYTRGSTKPENCVDLLLKLHYKWNDLDCKIKAHYICEKYVYA